MTNLITLAQEIRDLRRLLSNQIRVATVLSVDPSTATIIAKIGDIQTQPIKWATLGAHAQKSVWSPPAVGERCLLLAIGDDLVQSIALTGIFCADNPANGNEEKIYRTSYDDGTIVEYNANTNDLKADVQGTITINATGNIQVTTDADATLDAGGDITATCTNATIDASGTLDITAGGATSLDCPSFTVTCPATIFTGSVQANTGLLTGAGIATVSGVPVPCTAGFITTQDVVANGISLNSHTHQETGTGGGTTKGPQ